MIARAAGRRPAGPPLPARLDDPPDALAPRFGAGLDEARRAPREPAPAPIVAPLLVRLLAGDPLDRDQRAVIVGEVLRLWEVEAHPATVEGDPAPRR